MATDIVRAIEDGVEFFTAKETGESGMSVRGLGRMGDVSSQKISRLLSDLSAGRGPERLKAFRGKTLDLPHSYTKRGGKTRIIRAEVCAAIIKHLAFEGSAKAEFALDKFSTSGVNTWIQSITGWSKSSADTTRYLTGVVLLEPKQWTLHYSKEWQIEACRLTGEDWLCIRMGKFINESVYDWMPEEVQEELDRANPVTETGRRRNKQHQHFSEDASPVLRKHIEEVLVLMKMANSMLEFREFMNRNFSRRYQLALKLA